MAVAAALLLIALLRTDPGVAELELVAAQDVTLGFPTAQLSRCPWDELVEGSIITIAPEGRAVIGVTAWAPERSSGSRTGGSSG